MFFTKTQAYSIHTSQLNQTNHFDYPNLYFNYILILSNITERPSLQKNISLDVCKALFSVQK